MPQSWPIKTAGSKISKGIVKLDDFLPLLLPLLLPLPLPLPLRFRNPETGYQLIITLMELEIRIKGILYQIMHRTEATLENAISTKGAQGASSPAKLLLFKKRQSP